MKWLSIIILKIKKEEASYNIIQFRNIVPPSNAQNHVAWAGVRVRVSVRVSIKIKIFRD